MTPSPSSTPSYTNRAIRYARSIVDKDRFASKHTRNACQRFLDDLDRNDWRWTYNQDKAHRACKFVELMPHEKGQKQGQPLLLEDWQVFIVVNIFGWVDKDSRLRRFKEAVLIIPRKNGKSPLAAAMAIYLAFFDNEKGAEVYCGALTEKQAFEVFRPARAMLLNSPALCKRYGIQVGAKAITQPATASRFEVVIGRGRDGAMPHAFIGDEAHQWADSSLYDAQDTGMVGRLQPLKLIISTAGDSIEGPCYTKQKEVEACLDGTAPNDRLFGIIYTADPEHHWTSREALLSANPNLGVSVTEEYLIEAQQQALRNPSKQGTFRCKHLNHWITAASAWMNMELFRRCADPDLTPKDFTNDPCVLGSDLASKIDLSALVKLFRRDIDGKPHYYCFTRSYVPQAQVDNPANQHYQRWAADGWLTATEGSSMDYGLLEVEALEDIAAFDMRCLAYDERYADQFSQRVSELGGVDRVVVAPSPKELSPAMKELEAAVYDGRFHYDGNPLLEWAMGNVLTRETGGGNLMMPTKPRPEAKIDPAVALFIAMNRAMVLDMSDQSDAIDPCQVLFTI